MSEPSIYICKEIDYSNNGPIRPVVIHEISIPGRNSPGGYTQILSLNGFSYGQRRGASKLDKEYHRGGCQWGPRSLYRLQPEWEWIQELEADNARIKRLLPESNPLEEYGEETTEISRIPRIKHESIWAFYKAIGFDPKKRRHVDAEGKPVSYSVVPPKKEKPEATPAAG